MTLSPPPDADGERARALLAPLRDASPPAWTHEREQRVWSAVQARRSPPARARGWIAGLGVAAAALAFALVSRGSAPSDAVTDREVADFPAPQERLTVARALPSGARVEITDGAVRVAEATPQRTRLVLESGSVTSAVPRLQAGEVYVVETPHARISVHGTRFTVALTPGGTTRVSVTEGVVEVAPRDGGAPRRLLAGESTDVGGPRDDRVDDAAEPGTARAAAERGDWAEAVRRWQEVAARAPDTLARQNALVAAGHLLSRHDPAAAAAHWQALAASDPSGVHAEEAAWRAVEALRAAGRPVEAEAAARRFREAWPRSPYATP